MKRINRKGFTLIELLAVIAILGLIATIAAVSVNNVLNKADNDIDTIQEKMIVEAAKAYVADHLSDFKNNGGTVTFNKLVEDGLIDEIDGIDGSIYVTKNNNKFSYEISTSNTNGNIYNFPYTGECVYQTLEAGKYLLQVWGAQGGNIGDYIGGKGGYAQGTLTLSSKEVLTICVGGQPYIYNNLTQPLEDNENPGGFNGGGKGRTYVNPNKGIITIAMGGGGKTGIGIKSNGTTLISAGGGSGATSFSDGYGANKCGTPDYCPGKGKNINSTGDYGCSYGSGGGGGGYQHGGSITWYDCSDTDKSVTTYSGGGSNYTDYKNTTNIILSLKTDYSGEGSINSPSGSKETGHSGNGYARITKQ